MPANDERDPLEGWMNERIQPLPPPPGTFELISRRARRRRLRRAAATVTSAAAVTTALLVAVTNPTLLRLSPPPETGQTAANAASPGSGSSPGQGVKSPGQGTKSPGQGINQPNGSGKLDTSRPASSSPEGKQGPQGGPVPANFAPSSVTFVSPTRAWVIGQAGVPGSCYNGNICTSIAWTPDGGRTWHGEHAPVASAPAGPNGVGGIRFLDGVNGWAFGPELWATHDGGSSWHAVDTFGQRVTALETAGNRAYAVFANCSGNSGNGFAADCASFTLMTSPAGSDAWQPAGPETSDLRGGGSAALQVTGNRGYLLAPDGTVYSGPLGGAWAKAGTAPCDPDAPQSDGSGSGTLLAAAGPGHLALACADSSGTSVYTSGDGGSTWARYVSATGRATSLAAAPGGTLVLATTTGIYSLASGASQWQQATAASGGGLPSSGFSYVGMTSDTRGVALPANTSLHEIWMTADGGQTWTPRPVA